MRSRVGIVLSGLCFVLGIVAIGWMICYIIHYLQLGMGVYVGAFVIVAIIFASFWGYYGRQFLRGRIKPFDDCLGIPGLIFLPIFFGYAAYVFVGAMYYCELRQLYREYAGEYQGTRVDLTPREALLGDWEGSRAVERYRETLKNNGWECIRDSYYVKNVKGVNYVIDLSAWDYYGKSQVCIRYYTENICDPEIKYYIQKEPGTN